MITDRMQREIEVLGAELATIMTERNLPIGPTARSLVIALELLAHKAPPEAKEVLVTMSGALTPLIPAEPDPENMTELMRQLHGDIGIVYPEMGTLTFEQLAPEIKGRLRAVVRSHLRRYA